LANTQSNGLSADEFPDRRRPMMDLFGLSSGAATAAVSAEVNRASTDRASDLLGM